MTNICKNMIFTCALGARVIRIKSTKTEHKPIYFHSKPSTNMADNKQLKPTRHVTMKELYRWNATVALSPVVVVVDSFLCPIPLMSFLAQPYRQLRSVGVHLSTQPPTPTYTPPPQCTSYIDISSPLSLSFPLCISIYLLLSPLSPLSLSLPSLPLSLPPLPPPLSPSPPSPSLSYLPFSTNYVANSIA